MNTHSVELDGYYARSRGSSTIYLGTAGSHGNEQLQVTQGKGWEGLTVQVVFHPSKVAVQLPTNGLLDVPWEATAQPLTSMQGRIVFQGFDQDRLVNSTDLAYTVASHSPALGRDEEPYTPGIVEGVLNQMAADKDAILQAAQQTSQNKEAAAASAAEAAGSAANAQQSAGAANTSAGQAADSASQAAGSAAAAGETLTQVQTAGQEAQQKVQDAETEALDKIAAAAPALPAVSSDSAWQSVTVKPDGTGYNLAALAPIEATIRPTVTGNPAVCENSAAWGLQGLKIYGKSVQDGTPSPDYPIDIVSAGASGSINLNITGTNLVPFPYATSNTKVTNGITFTANADGIVKCVGTATSEAYYNFTLNEPGKRITLPPGNYIATVASGENVNCTLTAITTSTGTQRNLGFDRPFELMPGEEINTSIYVKSGRTVNTTAYLMLNPGSTALPWEPYQSHSLTLSTPSGLPGIPVKSGGTQVAADGQQTCNIVDFRKLSYTQILTPFEIKPTDQIKEYISNGTNEIYLGVIVSNSTSKLLKYAWGNDPSMICNRFVAAAGQDLVWLFKKEGIGINNGEFLISIRKTICPDIDSFTTWLKDNPIYGYAELASPITTSLSTEELAAYRAIQTYSGTTVVSTAEPVAGLEVQYVADGTKYAEKVQSMESRLAALEAAQAGI